MVDVTANDGTDDGVTSFGDQVTVVNTPPILSVFISPSAPTAGDTLIATPAVNDIDGDTVTVSYAWSRDGVDVGNGDTVPASQTAIGEQWRVIAIPNDSDADGSSADAMVTILNTVPSISTVTLSPTTAYEDTLLIATVTTVDPDNQSISYSYDWIVNSASVIGPTNSISGTYFDRDDLVQVSVKANDGMDDSNLVVSNIVQILNTAPIVSNVAISPSILDTNSVASCTGTASDIDNDSLTTSISWSVNGIFTSASSSLDGATYFAKGDQVQCTYMASDGTDQSQQTSPALTVQNTAPSITGVSISPTSPSSSDSLSCSYSGYSDADGDTDQSSITWYLGSSGSTLLGSGSTISSGFAGGDTVRCVVTPNDGSDSGAPLTATTTVINSPPSVSGVSVISATDNDGDGNSSTAGIADMLQCSYSFADLDGDGDQSTIEWFNGSTSLGSGNTMSGGYAVGDTVSCVVTPSDGTNTGTSVSDSITIGNSIPTVSSVSISTTTNADGDGDPSTAVEDDSLECSYTYGDADGDADASTIEWFIGSTSLGTGSSLSSGFADGDTVLCTVTPNDGSTAGSPVTAQIIISNAAPTVSAVTVSANTDADGDGDSSTAGPDDDLLCSYTYADPDQDPEGDSTMTWAVNGVGIDRSYVDVAVGIYHSCALSGEGVVECWGIEDPTDTKDIGQGGSNAPTGGDYVLIDAGYYHTCALTGTGEVDCWGTDSGDSADPYHDYGQVTGAPMGSGYVALALRYYFGCAVNGAGEITCWGRDNGGQVSDTPTGSGYTHIAAGYWHGCALDSAGAIACWGGNGDGLGDADPPTSSGYTAIDIGNRHGCALNASGGVECWGISTGDSSADSDYGQATDAPTGTGYTSLWCGNYHSCAADATGAVTCWGHDNDGESSPPSGDGYWGFDADLNHNCMLDSYGEVVCWGLDDPTDGRNYGQVTDTPTIDVLPSQYFEPGDAVSCTVTPNDGTDNGAPGSGSLTITDDNTTPTVSAVTVTANTDSDGDGDSSTASASDSLECSYTFDDADGDADESTITWTVNGADIDRSYVAVGAGGYHTCAVSAAGFVECWGTDSGNSAAPYYDHGQVTDAPTGNGYIDVSLGYFHSCALTTTGEVECWGTDSGDSSGPYYDYGQVTGAPTGGGYVEIAMLEYSSCALNSAGEITCWGRDDFGQVSLVPTGAGYSSVTVGYVHACAVDSGGSLACWGIDDDTNSRDRGQVSDMPTGSGYIAVAAGALHGCALNSSGSPACWGQDAGIAGSPDHNYGQVIDIPTGSGFSELSGGIYNNCVLNAAGEISCWGFDDYGQSTPPSGTDYWGVAVDHLHACALDSANAVVCWGIDDASASADLGQISEAPVPHILPPQYFEVGDVVSCSVTASDGAHTGSSEASANTMTIGEPLGSTSSNPGLSCVDLLDTGASTGDGLYWIDPLQTGTATEVYCVMDSYYDGGGWTLAAVSSDDGQDTWTWDDRAYWDTDTTTFGSLTATNEDFKSPALHEVAASDLLFIHQPSGIWAAYDGVADGSGGLDELIEDVGEEVCYNGNDGHFMTEGTLSVTGSLCSTQLFINPGDHDGTLGCSSIYAVNDSYGPGWSANSNNGCPLDDMAKTGSLGPHQAIPDAESADPGGTAFPVGFGWALSLNTGTVGDGENYMWVLVRHVERLGGSSSNPGRSCLDILDADESTGDGRYWIDPLNNGSAYEVYCVMDSAYDGGGWTLAAVSSDDGQDTWTWNNRAYWDTDTTTFGSLAKLDQDFKSAAYHELGGTDVLFVHAPSGEWAAYTDVSLPGETLADTIEATGETICYEHGDGYAMSAGTITVSGDLCSTELFFNAQDHDGTNGCGWGAADNAYGPVWSVDNNHGCPLDDAGFSGSLGPSDLYPTVETLNQSTLLLPIGFGQALSLNTGTVDAGENYMWVLVRGEPLSTGSGDTGGLGDTGG
jgi:alpha-tubulin suppressor-like RCC1 family protein